MKKFIPASLVLSAILFSAASHAASVRLITCKGTSATRGFAKFRVNVIQNKDTGLLKATFSEGYTNMNTNETWKVSMKPHGSQVEIRGLNKTPFALTIDRDQRAKVDDVEGSEARADLTYEVTPFGRATKTYEIEGKLACRFDR